MSNFALLELSKKFRGEGGWHPELHENPIFDGQFFPMYGATPCIVTPTPPPVTII
jgi:hypothetical protein